MGMVLTADSAVIVAASAEVRVTTSFDLVAGDCSQGRVQGWVGLERFALRGRGLGLNLSNSPGGSDRSQFGGHGLVDRAVLQLETSAGVVAAMTAATWYGERSNGK